jgi:hypothetical protein
MPTAYSNYLDPNFTKVGGYAWAIPFAGTIKWCSASADFADVEIMALEVYRAGSPIPLHAWILTALQPIPPSGVAPAAPAANDWDAAVYEPLGNLTVISGDEIRIIARNGGPFPANVAVSVGVIFDTNTGTISLNSFPVDYVPK